MSKTRKLARWVAWNIDGSSIKRISRNGIKFVKDSRLPLDSQLGNELYKNTPLDRGHLARRADLVWGTHSEAKRANVDSFHYTNIAPQHSDFNQSNAGGIWGELENAIFNNVDVNDLKVSVMAGPVFTEDDPIHRGVRLPKSFWKVIYYRDQGQKSVKALAYMLTQEDLINQLESLELPEFSVYEVSINELQDRVGLDLANVRNRRVSNKIETIVSNLDIRKIESMEDIIL
jgi:endonuclease G